MKVGFFGLLGLIFIVLKLTATISWSWWLVLLPLYGPLAIAFCLAFMAGVVVSVLK